MELNLNLPARRNSVRATPQFWDRSRIPDEFSTSRFDSIRSNAWKWRILSADSIGLHSVDVVPALMPIQRVTRRARTLNIKSVQHDILVSNFEIELGRVQISNQETGFYEVLVLKFEIETGSVKIDSNTRNLNPNLMTVLKIDSDPIKNECPQRDFIAYRTARVRKILNET